MKNTFPGSIILILLFFLSVGNSYSYNLRQISSKDGLSNSAILSLYQDQQGYVWFGTCDGLNMFDGLNIQAYQSNGKDQKSLSGNLIASITETEEGILWVETNYGLNKLDKRKGTIEYHNQFTGSYKVAKTIDNHIFVVLNDNKLYYYNRFIQKFQEVDIEEIVYNNLLHFFIDEKNVLWLFFDNGKTVNALISFKDDRLTPALTFLNTFTHPGKIIYAFNQSDKVFFIDEEHDLFEFNSLSNHYIYIQNVTSLIKEYGIISSIIRDNNDYWIAFESNGVVRLKYMPAQKVKYQIERIDINCGVFSLLKDKNQDIIWVGTDGQGVYMYSNESFSLKSFLLNDLSAEVDKPVRALFIDKDNTLWLGTKGDGLLRFPNFNVGGQLRHKEMQKYTTANSLLGNNNVYSFAESRRDLIWIGGDGPGISYYSFKDKKIHHINYGPNNEEIKYIHAICELSDSVLWVSSVGLGILKISLGGSSDFPVIKDVKRFLLDDTHETRNYFFSIFQENDSIIWFGNRGYGAFRMNVNKEKSDIFRFGPEEVQSSNDILSFHRDKYNNLWFGTSLGIYRKRLTLKEQPIYEYRNFPNNTVHGILGDSQNKLWLSTNRGIIEFDPEKETFKTYLSEIDVTEFSDGAFFKDKKTGIMYFGGTNGFVTIKEDTLTKETFMPPLIFSDLRIFDKNVDLTEYLHHKNGQEVLTLSHNQNFFSLSFTALDYINGMNYTYQYKLENLGDQWIDNGNQNTVTITNLLPGTYTLTVKYNNRELEENAEFYSMKIKILPPWYQSGWAYFVYFAISLFVFFFLIRMASKRQSIRREIMLQKLQQEQKEEIYESKLKFFINITHDLCTPLTLIYGPCQRILQYEKSDNFIKKYTLLIQRNAEKLNDLIQDLIEFRRIDTGNKKCEIELLDITEMGSAITESFEDLSETKFIDYEVNIDPSLEWTTDRSCFNTIVTNLISNAFKYTPKQGKITVNITTNNNNLEVIISNTGKGIKKEDIPLIFDRYSVLDNIEKQSEKGISPRNGLGLAICFNMVKLLNGELTVESIPNEITTFKVTHPRLQITTLVQTPVPEHTIETQEVPVMEKEGIESVVKIPEEPVFKEKLYEFKEFRPTILIVDDDTEVLWFIADVLSDKYNVIPMSDSTLVMGRLQEIQPDLIISDIMMPGIDGATLTKEIKSNKQTAHIPIILLSAKQHTEDQIKGIESGAELYITKPFEIEYLKIVVDKLFLRKEDLKNYLTSSLSSFELTHGKFIHKEDNQFFKKMISVIDENMTNINLSPDFVASALGMSTRQFYRKVKDISGQTPGDVIKEYKIFQAEQMLTKTNLSIDEVIYKSGFVNRGTFFKLFMKKYGHTPKNYRKQKLSEAGIIVEQD